MSTNRTRREQDVQVVHEVQAGNTTAFNVLVEQYWTAMLGMVLSMGFPQQKATEIVQDAFLKAFCAINQFQGGSFKAWLRRIVRNTALNNVRRSTARRAQFTREFDDTRGDRAGTVVNLPQARRADQVVHQQQVSVRIHEALAQLPEAQREALVLYHYDDLSYLEIAEVQGIKLGTVMSRISRARHNLREILEPHRNELLAAAS